MDEDRGSGIASILIFIFAYFAAFLCELRGQGLLL